MHAFFSYLFGAYVQLLDWTSDLSMALGSLAHRAAAPGELALASVVVASLIVCVLGCAWAVIERMRAAARHYTMSNTLARAQSEIRFREAVILATPEAIVVMGADMAMPLSYRGGSALLQACLAGPDSAALAARLDALMESGAPFALTVRTTSNPGVAVQGCVVGSRAAVFLRIQDGSTALERDLKFVLEALPAPVWIRDRKFALTWANRAFLAATGAGSLENALASDPRLIRAERDLVGAVLDGNDVYSERRYTVVEGRRRALSIDLVRLPSAHVAGMALDVTESAQAEAQLGLSADAFGEMMDRANAAIAIFGADRRLVSWNKLFAQMWDLPKVWLAAHPRLEDVFDRLRETRRLPEQRDFPAWKREHMRLFECDDGRVDEVWHLSGGVSVQVKAHPYLLGGAYYLFEDVSESLRLTASQQLLSRTQRALLDTVRDGMAVFGVDGKLKMHNAAFAELWKLGDEDVAGEPHLAKVAALCSQRIGRDGIWSMISSGVTSSDPARHGEWGRVTRADGRALLLTLTRLPMGATLVTFEDNTDIERFDAAVHAQTAMSSASAQVEYHRRKT